MLTWLKSHTLAQFCLLSLGKVLSKTHLDKSGPVIPIRLEGTGGDPVRGEKRAWWEGRSQWAASPPPPPTEGEP